MVTTNASIGLSVYGFNFSNLFKEISYKSNPTQFTVNYESGAVDIFRGKNFEYNKAGELIDGTIKSYQLKRDGEVSFEIVDANFDAGDMWDAGRTKTFDDDLALIKKIFKGNDTLNGSNEGDQLDGFAGNDKLLGKGSEDILIGGVGNDRLSGGGQSDVFRFMGNDGIDTITDFDATGGDQDVVDLSDVNAISNYSDLSENHLSENNKGDAVISFGNDEIILEKIAVDDLGKDNFQF